MLVNCIEGIQRNHILILHTDKRFLSLTQTTLIKLSPSSFHALGIHTLRILGLEHSSVVEHSLHMNKAWIQKKKKKTQEGRERKKRKGRFWHYAMCTEATFSCAPPLRELQWIQQRWLMGNLPKVLRKRGYHQFFFFLCSLRWDLHTDVPTYSLRLILTTIISQ